MKNNPSTYMMTTNTTSNQKPVVAAVNAVRNEKALSWLLLLLLFLFTIPLMSLAEGNPKKEKLYAAKVYLKDKEPVAGILVAVSDSTITIGNKAFFLADAIPADDTLSIMEISYRDIKKINVIRSGAVLKGAGIGMGTGLITGLLGGAAIDVTANAVIYAASLGTVEQQSNGAFIVATTVGCAAIGGIIGAAVGMGSSTTYHLDGRPATFKLVKERLIDHTVEQAYWK